MSIQDQQRSFDRNLIRRANNIMGGGLEMLFRFERPYALPGRILYATSAPRVTKP
jgi:hypothetical protein